MLSRPHCPRRAATTVFVICALGLGSTGRAADESPRPPKDFEGRLEYFADEANWMRVSEAGTLDRELLNSSVEGMRHYYLRHQRADGSFDYEYELGRGARSAQDNQVRQAGAAWGLASLFRERPTVDTQKAVIRGLDFFFRCTEAFPGGLSAPAYPGRDGVKTGMVALVCLGITDFVRGTERVGQRGGKGIYVAWLGQYLEFLQAMELGDGSWSEGYIPAEKQAVRTGNPYSDGECLLAYCRAARYMRHEDLVPRIEAFAPVLARRYVVDAWEDDPDSDLTKGFFPWGCLAFLEYIEAGWRDGEILGDAVLAMAWWMIHRHGVRFRQRNTGYAVEGLLAAYRVAQLRQDHAAAERLREVIEEVLLRLTGWQVGGPLKDRTPFLRKQRPDPRALGGVMDREDSGLIRIDIVQHQLHASLLALKYLFPRE